MFQLPQDAHQFVVTARVRASEILARSKVGRVCTINEMRPPTTITFNYPPEFRHLIPQGQRARHERAGFTTRSVAFATVPAPERGMYGYVVFSGADKAQAFTLRPEMGPDHLARQVAEFMAYAKSPEFPPEMVV